MSLFDQLRNDLFANILHYFQYDEIVILRNVNRRFRELVDAHIASQVVWFKRDEKEMQFHVLFDMDEEKFVFNCLASYSLTTFRNTNVHHLIRTLITFNPFIVLDLEFVNLEHLEIENRSESFKRHPVIVRSFINLNLDKLRRLKIDLNKKPITFYLNCRSLSSLYVNGSAKHFKVCFPERLTSLTCSTTAGLRSFKNLKQLSFLEFSYVDCHHYLLDELPRLEKVEIHSADRKSLDKLWKEKIASRRPTPTIFYNGFDIEMEKFNYDLVFNQFSGASVGQNHIELLRAHLDSLSDTLQPTTLYKVDLENVPYELLLKFDYVNEINLSISLTDVEKWQRILLLYRLRSLKIKLPTDQQFLELIPTYQSTLRCLRLGQCEDMSFVLRLIYLRELRTKQFFDKRLFKQMLERLNYLEEVYILKYFVFLLDDNSVSCIQSNTLTFKESRRLFLTTTVNSIPRLECLFRLNPLYIQN